MTDAVVSARSRNGASGRFPGNQSFTTQGGIRRSFAPEVRAGRTVTYGDKIQVCLDRIQPGGGTLARFILTEVHDMSEIYGELRHHTRGMRGLTRLTVRNMTRGWSLSQPFMLYDESYRRPARSVTHAAGRPVL